MIPFGNHKLKTEEQFTEHPDPETSCTGKAALKNRLLCDLECLCTEMAETEICTNNILLNAIENDRK